MRKFVLTSGLTRATICVLLACSVLAGCQTTNPGTKAASDQWRMMSLEENFLEFKETQQQETAQAHKTQELLKERMMALEEQVAALRTELAETRGAMKQASMQKMEPVVRGAESAEDKPWSKVPQPGPTDTPKMASKKPAKKAMKSPPKPAKSSSAAMALYEKGQHLAASEKAEEGRKVLDSFLAKYPKSKLVPNAMYWRGETFYVQKNYPQAILAFKDVTQKYPKHSKAQAALLKIGMAYKNVGDTDNAVFYLRTLVDEHPKSSPAKIARKLLEDIPG